MKNTGERQVSTTLQGIAHDHVSRYTFAARYLFDKFGSATIIDSACGIGYGSKIMAEFGHKVLAIDISDEAIEFARTHYNHPNITFVQSDAYDIAPIVSERNADAVVSFETIEHVKDAHRLIKVFSLSAPLLICSVPNESVVPFTKETHPFHDRHYTDAEFESLLNDYDFDVVETYTQRSKTEGTLLLGKAGRTLIKVAELLGKVPA